MSAPNTDCKISVIIPVYNTAPEYLTRCLESMRNQSLSNIEVIVIDDGSTKPETLEVLRTFKNSFLIIHKENQGVSTARNMGIDIAQGEWISFVDADDWVDPTMMQRLLAEADSSNSQPDIVVCDCSVEYDKCSSPNRFFKHNSFQWNEMERENTLLQIFGKNKYYNPPEIAIGVPWAKLYRRSFLQENKLKFQTQLRRMQDNIFNLEAFSIAQQITYLAVPLYHYRKNAASTSNRFSPEAINDFRLVLQASEKFKNQYSNNAKIKNAYNNRVIQSIHSLMKFYYFNKQNPYSFKENKEELLHLLDSEPYKSALENLNLADSPKGIVLLALLVKLRLFRLLSFLIQQES